MKIPFYFFTFFLSFSFVSNANDLLLSTSFLKQYHLVRSLLKKTDFQEIEFKTPDGLNISGLFLSRPNARCNVIISAGWLPGRKEGMASFYHLIPEDCNLLLFDARGHGESDGHLLWKIWRYGIDEYKDFLGAINYLNKENSLPIILGGTCSGVFNATHAIVALTKYNKLEKSRVKGLIFDSGWGCVTTMSKSAALTNIKKTLRRILSMCYRSKENIKNNIVYNVSSKIICGCFSLGHFLFARPILYQYEHKTNLFDKIHTINIPILFIHSFDDTHADSMQALKLAELAPNKNCWWIEQSYHSKHHLIHTAEYKNKLVQFIDQALMSTTVPAL